MPQQQPAPVTRGLASDDAAAAITPSDFISLLLDDVMLTEIVRCTNIQIQRKRTAYAKERAVLDPTSLIEIKALIGLLLHTGANNDNHMTVEEMFSPRHGPSIYRSTMTAFRFNFLLRCIRFDDLNTREERQKTDKFAPFRYVFERFVANCGKHYNPGQKLTIDEQLLAFRGKCPFRMYMPKKPTKYGIKIVMICDAETFYMCNAETYLGKNPTRDRRNVGIAHATTMTLLEPFLDVGRTLTMDNWFTSLPLAKDLLTRNTTCVGTIRKKPYIPTVMLGKERERREKTSVFLFDYNTTLVSFKDKKDKTVMLLSTLHHKAVIGEKAKPEIIHYYNTSKGGVDVLDYMCASYNTSRKTQRWPCCMFFGLLNIASINAFILYNEPVKTRCAGFSCRRWHMT